MADVNAILNQRTKKTDNSSKMMAMAKQSSAGHLTSFSGIFNVTELSEKEKNSIANILKEYGSQDKDIQSDLTSLLSITSEVKAINNQAAILHGERIKKAQTILTCYRDGAFTAWLLAAYGNRQTPYNLMLYYEFYESLPKEVRPQIESMPRQAIYTLASRKGSLDKKQEIIENYKGETKTELLHLIRQTFPLDGQDKRGRKVAEGTLQLMRRLYKHLKATAPLEFSLSQQKEIEELLNKIQQLIGVG